MKSRMEYNKIKYFTPAVYGPVISRRLGNSLGINLFLLGRKICSFDCIYCQCGKSKCNLLRNSPYQEDFLKPEELRQEIERCFQWHSKVHTKIDYITFAGNGEPTLYPWFEEAVDIVLEMRDKYLLKIPTAIFTNATLLNKKNIIRTLYKINRRFMKLDAGDQQTYQLIDKPLIDMSFENIVTNLSKLREIEISIAVVTGVVSNIKSLMSESFIRVIKKINPIKIFIYAIDRPSAYSGISKSSKYRLKKIGDFLNKRLSVPVNILESKKHRLSWFEESYSILSSIELPVVYNTEEWGYFSQAEIETLRPKT